MYKDLVATYNSGRLTKLKWARFKALLNCLSPQDACTCAIEMLQTDHNAYMREAMCKKLAVDISRQGWQECHEELIDQLLLDFYLQPTTYNHQQYAFVLSQLARLEDMPQLVRARIIPHLLDSHLRSVRKYGYDALEQVAADDFVDEIEAAWKKESDVHCARLIVNQLPIPIQEKHFDSLYAAADDWSLKGLYLHITLFPERLYLLRESDGITYAYICAKRGVPITDEEACVLWEQYKKDERAGLLIWCFGQLEMWNFLSSMQFGRQPKTATSTAN